jgi:hypothetical protein
MVSVVGCRTGDSINRGVVIRDTTIQIAGRSTSVRIVENPDRAPSNWALSQDPTVDVGGEGDDHAPFFGIARAIRMSDGRIVVADGGSMMLRVLTTDGHEQDPIGGPGEGPGEFRSFTYVGQLPGDSLVVADLELARVSVFDPTGHLAREQRWGNAANSPSSAVVGVFDDGSLLSRGFIQLGYPPPHGLRRHPALFFHLAPDGTLADTVGEFLGGETYYLPTERGFRANPGLFGQRLSFATAGNEVYVGMSDTYEILVFSSAGQPLLRVRRAKRLDRVSPADVAAEKELRLSLEPPDGRRASLERMLAEMPVPEQMPAFDRVLVDDEQNIWVRDYHPTWRSGPVSWAIFEPSGQIVAEITMPANLEPEHIGRNFMLGIAKDESDVERVRLYRLDKSS